MERINPSGVVILTVVGGPLLPLYTNHYYYSYRHVPLVGLH